MSGNMPLTDSDTDFAWDLVHPNRYLSQPVSESLVLGDVFTRALDMHPPTMKKPRRLVVAWDEFVPGKKLAYDNNRKCMNMSFSFLELGQTALYHNWAWFTPVCLRTQMVKRTKGGWPAYLRASSHIQLLGTDGLTTAGTPVVIRGQSTMTVARLSSILSDGDGLRMALDWKGHASMKP